MNLPPELLGPLGLTVGLVIAVVFLWREDRRVYRERIEELKAQRDAANTRADVATAGWKAQTDANAVLANDIASRRRRADG